LEATIGSNVHRAEADHLHDLLIIYAPR